MKLPAAAFASAWILFHCTFNRNENQLVDAEENEKSTDFSKLSLSCGDYDLLIRRGNPPEKSVTILGTDGTVYVEGESDLTITVKEYQPEADLSGAGEAEDWEDYEVEEPEMWQEEETNEAYSNH